MGEQIERAEAGDESGGNQPQPGIERHGEQVPGVRDDLASGVDLRYAIHFLGIGQRLQAEVVPQKQHENGQRCEQEVPPGAHVRVAILAIAREEQIEAVGDTRCEGNGVAEGIGGIEIERQALGSDDAHDEQHADYHGDDAKNATPINLFLEEDRRKDRRVNGAGVNEERRVRQRRVLGGQAVQAGKQPQEDAREQHHAREPRGLHLLEAADKQEDDRERNKAREVAPERHEVAWGVNEARERSDAAHQR